MHSFNDRSGEAWDLDLNVGSAMRLQSRLKIRIEDAVSMQVAESCEKSLLEKISEDSILLFNIVFVLCEDQVQKRGLTADDFAARFDGNTIDNATTALMDELLNFSRPAQRKILLQLRKIGEEISERANNTLTELIATADFQTELENRLTKSSTSSPDASA